MSEAFAITFFITMSAGALFFLPFIKKEFSKNEITNMILRRCCWVIALYLMAMNSAIMATIAAANLNLQHEVFRYLWLYGNAGYVVLVFTVIKTLFDVMKMWKIKKYNKVFSKDV